MIDGAFQSITFPPLFWIFLASLLLKMIWYGWYLVSHNLFTLLRWNSFQTRSWLEFFSTVNDCNVSAYSKRDTVLKYRRISDRKIFHLSPCIFTETLNWTPTRQFFIKNIKLKFRFIFWWKTFYFDQEVENKLQISFHYWTMLILMHVSYSVLASSKFVGSLCSRLWVYCYEK